MKADLNELLKAAQNLSDEERRVFAEQIMDMLKLPTQSTAKKDSCNDMVMAQLGGKPDCPHCHAPAKLGFIVKRGFNKDVQRYYCKSCGHVFVAATNTAFERTRKDAEVWRKYIEMTLEGKSLKRCASECGLSYQTAFTWRHKILNVFSIHQEGTKMTGTVQMDEMQLPLSFKGNHIKGAFVNRTRESGLENGFPADRAPVKRGTDNRNSSSKTKACVLCMIEDENKTFYGAVPGVGFMMPDMLDATVGRHVDKTTALIIADQYKATVKYLEDNHYRHMHLASRASKKAGRRQPEIRGKYHIQNINSLHHHLKDFLRKYHGVSSKYLAGYVSLFMWLKNAQAKKQNKNIQSFSVGRAAAPDCYITRKRLEARPAVPKCA